MRARKVNSLKEGVEGDEFMNWGVYVLGFILMVGKHITDINRANHLNDKRRVALHG